MPSLLSFPVMDKLSESGGNNHVLFAATGMQAWRKDMEDTHAAVLQLEGGSDQSHETNSFFAVYDGHGGAAVAKFAAENVHQKLVLGEDYREMQYEVALKRAFLATDEDLLANPEHTTSGGTTALAALVTQCGKIYVANVGDSGCTISTAGKEEQLSYDHSPDNPDELRRVTRAGGFFWRGFVQRPGGLGDGLGMARALGDVRFKRNASLAPEDQIIIANPDIISHEITKEDEFLILATDGIWDCLTSQQGIDFVRYHISKGKTLSEICEMMCDYCLSPNNRTNMGFTIGLDNTTVIVVAILHGRTKEEWYAWVTDRVENAGVPLDIPRLYSADEMSSFKELVEVEKRVRELGLENAGKDLTTL